MGVREERLSVVCLEIIGGGLFQEINYIGFLFLGVEGVGVWKAFFTGCIIFT